MNSKSDNNFRNVLNGYSYSHYSENDSSPYLITSDFNNNIKNNGNLKINGNVIESFDNAVTYANTVPVEFNVNIQKIKDTNDNISNTLLKISNNDTNNKGLRDDMSGNKLYDYNTEFKLEKEKTVLDGRIYDNKIIYEQNNAVFVLSTITAASLIVLGISMAMK